MHTFEFDVDVTKKSLKSRIKRAMLRDLGVPYSTLLDYTLMLHEMDMLPLGNGLGANRYYDNEFVNRYDYALDCLFCITLHQFYLNNKELLDYCRL